MGGPFFLGKIFGKADFSHIVGGDDLMDMLKRSGGSRRNTSITLSFFSFERTVMFLFWIFHSGTRIEVRQL
jgi:hypothetical protein